MAWMAHVSTSVTNTLEQSSLYRSRTRFSVWLRSIPATRPSRGATYISVSGRLFRAMRTSSSQRRRPSSERRSGADRRGA